MKKILHIITFVITLLAYAPYVQAVCDPAIAPENCACTSDLNGDGMIADSVEMQTCSNLSSGGLCPFGKTNCSRPSPTPVTATGFYCPLTNSASGCVKGAYNTVIDPETGNFATGEPANFVATYNVGSYFMTEIMASTNAWMESITCEGPPLAPDTRTRVELCTNPPASAPVPATNYWCPLTNTQTGCYRGLFGYVVDPYTGQYHYGPRTPNYSTFTSQYTQQTSYTNYIAGNPMNHLSVISCTNGSQVALCQEQPTNFHCPVPSGGACETIVTTHEYYNLMAYCPPSGGILNNLICLTSLANFQQRHIGTQRFYDFINSTSTDNRVCTATQMYGDWSTTDLRSDVDLCDNVPVSVVPAQLTISPQPTEPTLTPTSYTCPYAGQACVADDVDGVMRCSNQACYDKTISTVDPTELQTTMYTADAAYNDQGECMGELYIFNGRAMRCHPSAIKTMFRNCCGDPGDELPESVGSEAEMGLKMEAIGLTAAVVYDAAVTTYSAIANGWGVDAAVGAATAAGEQAATSFLTSGWNIAFLSIAVLNYLYEGACDQLDLETAMLNHSGMCYSFGTRCVDDSVLGCLKRQTTYCCFNSKLARIVHQQARPQFPNVDWGTISQPNCRGFTPLEFQAINFSQIDMGEYYDFMRQEVEEELPNIQQNINTNIQDSLQNLR